MPSNYGFADGGEFRDVNYSRYCERERRHPAESRRFTPSEERPCAYQPPSTPRSNKSSLVNNENTIQPEFCKEKPGKAPADYVTNDLEFISFASRILSSIEDDESDENTDPNGREKSVAITIMLQKLMLETALEEFSVALDIRLKCMPKSPATGESHLFTIIRRCEKEFGKELRMLLQINNKSNQEGRHAFGQTHFAHNQHQGHGGRKFGPAPDRHSEIGIAGQKLENSHSMMFQCKKNSNTHLAQNHSDLTDHIVWEEEVNKEAKNINKTKGSRGFEEENDPTVCETISSVSTQLYDSDIYDIIVEPMENEASMVDNKTAEDKKIANQFAERRSDAKFDDGDKSVASMYSITRERVVNSPEPMHRKIVSVKAPESLPENFMFEARRNDEVFMVHVPKGGVKRGQIFQSYALDLDSASVLDPTGRTKRLVDMNSPALQWRDGLFSVFANGIFHPMFLNSFLFPHIALAQVMSRMQLDSSGNKTLSLRSRVNFEAFRLTPVVLTLLHGVLFFLMLRAFHLHLRGQLWVFIYSSIPILAIDILLYIYFIYLTVKTRRTIRQEFNIRETGCLGFRDEALSLFFTPFVIAQMGRHTADYETFVGNFCTQTGLSDHIEVKLPSDENNQVREGLVV